MNTKEQLKGTKRTSRSAQGSATLETERLTALAAEGFMDKSAVADRLGVRPRTVGEWANQGKLPAYRLGPYLRFKWAEVEAHLAATCRCVPHGPSASLATMPRGPLGDC